MIHTLNMRGNEAILLPASLKKFGDRNFFDLSSRKYFYDHIFNHPVIAVMQMFFYAEICFTFASHFVKVSNLYDHMKCIMDLYDQLHFQLYFPKGCNI